MYGMEINVLALEIHFEIHLGVKDKCSVLTYMFH